MSRAQSNPGFWHTYPDRQHWTEQEREEAEHAEYVARMLAPYDAAKVAQDLKQVLDIDYTRGPYDPVPSISGNDYPLACTD